MTFTSFNENSVKGITINLPAQAPDSISSVIKLEVRGAVDFEKALPTQSPDGTLVLKPDEAYLHSNSKRALKVEVIDGKENIGNWQADKSWIYWEFRTTHPGTFTLSSEAAAESDVALTYQLKDGKRTEAPARPDEGHKIYAAEEFATLEGYEKTNVLIPATGSENSFKPVELGTLKINEPGVYVLEIRPVKDQWNSTKFRAIQLKLME